MPGKRNQVKVYMTPDRYEWMRRAAFDRRMSHSDLVEAALDAYRLRLARDGRRGVRSGEARDRAAV